MTRRYEMKGPALFDAHCDTVSHCLREGCSLRENDGQLDLLRLGRFDRAAQIFAMFSDSANAPAEGMFSVCRRQQELFARELEQNADLAAQCRCAEEAERTNAAGKIAAFLSCEGAELLDCDPANLAWAQAVGVRSVNLTWNHANRLAGSHCEEPERGLSGEGRAFVREAQRRGILIDVSHCSDATFWDLLRITERPVIATHSCARSVCPHTRNLTDDMFRAIVETGGFAGVNLYVPFIGGEASIEDVLRHFDRFLELGGEKHLGLGADLDGCDALAGGFAGVQDMPRLYDALLRHGYGGALADDLFYHNLLRVIGCL